MTFETIALAAMLLAGGCAASRLTIVGVGVVSAILAAMLVMGTLLAGLDFKVGILGLGLWVLFNVSYFLSGVALGVFGGRLAHWRSRLISLKDAKSN
jgi:hypothetical protein